MWDKKTTFFLTLPAVIIIAIFSTVNFIKNIPTSYPSDQQTIAKGETLFNTKCRSCHSLADDGIGPRLGGITNLLNQSSLKEFIRNPSKLIESGDKRANNLYKRYKQLMPSFEVLKDDDIRSILAYIDYETDIAGIKPLKVNNEVKERLVPGVKRSGLIIELNDFIKIPRADTNPADKGIATLRTNPSEDGSIFVSDQVGIIYRIENGKADTFLNVKSAIPDFTFIPGISTGLGSFAFHPDYLHNRLIYTTHAEPYTGKPADFQFADTFKFDLQWVLSEWKINDVNAKKFNGTRRELLRINEPTTSHGVQDIAFAPVTGKNNSDYGMLFIGIGDGGSNDIKRSDLIHNKQSLLGTVIRIDPLGKNSKNARYGIPPDNPFVNDKDSSVRKEIWAYGFRNPHHISWDTRNNGRMLVTDIGESNIEELNVIDKGGDYGWPVREGNFRIEPKEDMNKLYPLNDSEQSLYHAPFAVYDHIEGNAISGGFVYEGILPALKNKLVFGDIVNGKLFYVNIDSKLSDSSVYELSIKENGRSTNLQKLNNTKRVHLRIGYDPFKKELFIMTKNGMIRKVTNAFVKKS